MTHLIRLIADLIVPHWQLMLALMCVSGRRRPTFWRFLEEWRREVWKWPIWGFGIVARDFDTGSDEPDGVW